MFATRIGSLCAALSLAACTLALDDAATGVAPLQFTEAAVPDGANAANLLEAPADGDGADLLSALFAPPPSAPTVPAHTFGDPVPYGEIAKVCDAPRQPGRKITSAGGFTIYDSAPGSTGLRTHYITGFEDRCARQFTAALVLTGDVRTHEFLRYLPSTKAAYNATDEAYESLKARFCGVRSGKPCGRRLDALSRSTTFITAYQSFGAQPRWVEILLHDGEVAGIDFKTR